MKMLLPLALLLLPALALADVADSSAAGFTVKQSFAIQAPPADVYQRLLKVGEWWNSAHTFSGDAHNLSIELKAMGCFCEKLPNGGAVRHLEVVNFAPGKTLVMTGGLGPLQSVASSGVMTIQITPVEGGSKLDLTYAVSGYFAAGMNAWAAPVDGVLKEQFTRLKNYAEHGKP
jgi:uncharacterized protein YndB with AHSA1/START domain